MSQRGATEARWSLGAVLGLAAVLGCLVLIMACWTWWADDLTQVQQRIGADSVAGQALAGFLPTGLFCWLVATHLACASRWGPLARRVSLAAAVAVGIVSFLTVPVVVGGRGSGVGNLTSSWGDAIAATPEPFRAGRIAAFALVNGTLAVLLLSAVLFVAASWALGAMRRGRPRAPGRVRLLGRTAVRATPVRWIAVAYLLVAPVVALLVIH